MTMNRLALAALPGFASITGLALFAGATTRLSHRSPAIQAPVHSDSVRTCQIGYLPNETKYAMIVADAAEAVVRNVSDGRPVLTVGLTGPQDDPDTGDRVRLADFSALRRTGNYYLDVAGVGASFPFRIAKDAFAGPFRLAMRMYTGQRCGTKVSLAPDFPQYHHEECHLLAEFHSSSGKTGPATCTRGWHDAGDFGRYVVNSGITTGTLLWAYELNPRKLRPVRLDLPESGNGTPDILNEIRWNIDWMLQMQDADGGVWHKATTAQFSGFIMPEADRALTEIVGSGTKPFKTTASTADFAAVCAIAGRVFQPFDAKYSARCLAAAERAWTWLHATPDAPFNRNPPGINTGGYGDGDLADERLWAAAELFRTTGKPDYNAYFLANYMKWKPTLSPNSAQGWGDVRNMGMYTYALSNRKEADPIAVSTIRRDAVMAADALVLRAHANAYRIPMRSSDYGWGSNSDVGNFAMMLSLANRFAPKAEYRNGAQDVIHYLLGRNTFDTSFVTQVGHRWPMHPHHRQSAADGIEQPWPGMLVGGPNANGRMPQPAKQWVDKESDYTRNEIAINWNAPLVFLLAEAMP